MLQQNSVKEFSRQDAEFIEQVLENQQVSVKVAREIDALIVRFRAFVGAALLSRAQTANGAGKEAKKPREADTSI